MTKKEKSARKKTPKKSEEENPAMQEADINRLLQNALDQANAKAEQKLEERLKALEAELTKKYQDERIELQDAFEQSRGEKPSTKETYVFKEAMFDAVKAANHSSYVDKKTQIPNRFLELLVLAWTRPGHDFKFIFVWCRYDSMIMKGGFSGIDHRQF